MALMVGGVAAAGHIDVLFADSDGVSVTREEVEHYLSAYGPARGTADLAKVPNIEMALENIYISKIASRRANQLGGLSSAAIAWIGEDAVRRQLMTVWLDDELLNRMASVDWEQLCQEYYLANPSIFQTPETVRASHILISTEGKRLFDVMVSAEEVRLLALSGEDFGALAQQYSEGPSAEAGGDLGYFTRGEMVKAFDEVAFEMEIGEVSDLVVSAFGVHIIKLTDKKPPSQIEYAQVKDKIRESLERDVAQERREGILQEVRSNVLRFEQNVNKALILEMRTEAQTNNQ